MKKHLALGLVVAAGAANLFATDAVPAQPLTNLKTPTRADSSDDSDPFNIVQLDDRVLFFARNNAGYGLYVRDLSNPDGTGTSDPVVDLTVKKHGAIRVRQFRKTQTWDPNYQNIVEVDDPFLGTTFKTGPTEGTLFFHVPGQGLYYSKGSGGTTKKLLDVDVTADNSNFRWLNYLAGYRADITGEGKVFFAGDGRKTGVELFVATGGTRPRAKLFADIIPGTGSSFPYLLSTSFKTLYFGAFSSNANSYQLFKTDGENPPTPVTSSLVDYPLNIVNDGSGGTYFSAPTTATRANGGIDDLFFVDSDGNFSQPTNGQNNPYSLTYLNGSQVLFVAKDNTLNNTGYEIWSVSGGGTASVRYDINPLGGSNPDKLTNAGGQFIYFSATPDGTEASRRLYRADGFTLGLEAITEQNTGLPILMDSTSEIMPVMRIENGQLLGRWVYFTGTAQGGSEKLLYRIDNDNYNVSAIRVTTPLGNPVKHAHNLGKFVASGLGTYRLYFSCDGSGTEFSDTNATDKRFLPRGNELWCTEVGL